MYRYAVAFHVIIDGKDSELGTIGSSSNSPDYYPNQVKQTVTDYYKRQYPDSKIAVIIKEARQLKTEEEYQEAAKSFIDLTY